MMPEGWYTYWIALRNEANATVLAGGYRHTNGSM